MNSRRGDAVEIANGSFIVLAISKTVSGQIGLRHKASITARGASGRNLRQGVLQAMPLYVAHDMSYRS
jgi:hypothetical protein